MSKAALEAKMNEAEQAYLTAKKAYQEACKAEYKFQPGMILKNTRTGKLARVSHLAYEHSILCAYVIIAKKDGTYDKNMHIAWSIDYVIHSSA